jgi:hypothetical protein
MNPDSEAPEQHSSEQSFLMKPHQPNFNLPVPSSSAPSQEPVVNQTPTPLQPIAQPQPTSDRYVTQSQPAFAVSPQPTPYSPYASPAPQVIQPPTGPDTSEQSPDNTLPQYSQPAANSFASPQPVVPLVPQQSVFADPSAPPLVSPMVYQNPVSGMTLPSEPVTNSFAGTQPGGYVMPPGVPVVGTFAPIANAGPSLGDVKPKRNRKKLSALLLLAVLVLGGGGASAYYVGYYDNSSLLYGQALSNTGKAYTKLISYIGGQAATNYKGTTGSGTYKIVDSGTDINGTLNFATNGGDSDTKVGVNLGVADVGADIRTIQTSDQSDPDIYFKLNGISGLGSLLGASTQDAQSIDQLNNKWIMVDQSLLTSLQTEATGQAKASSMMDLTQADLFSELNAFGSVNQQYVFSTNKSTAVTTIVKKYGTQTINGHKLYHYEVGFNKANVKKYIAAQQTALLASKFGTWIKDEDYTSTVTSAYQSLESAADQITSKDTIQLWADMNTRIIYQVRVSDPSNSAESYVDLGLNYKSSGSYPFFVDLHDDENSSVTDFEFLATLNTKENSVDVGINAKQSGSSGFSVTGNFTFKPTTSPETIAVPQGAEQLSQVLDQLGYGSLLTTPLSSLSDPLTSGGSLTGSSTDGSSTSGGSDTFGSDTSGGSGTADGSFSSGSNDSGISL